MGSRKYIKLNDKSWLYNEYISLGKSAIEIAKNLGAKTGNSVRQALIRHSIPIRNRSDAQIFDNPDMIFNEDVIHGCLLGDAGLRKSNKTTDTTPHFYKKNIHYNHLAFVAKSFYSEWENRIFTEKKYYIFRTFANSKLNHEYKAWYPNNKKVIPEHIRPTSTLLLHWFLDDGSSYIRRPHSKTKQIIITLSSECFSKPDQDLLCEKVNSTFNLGMKTTTCNSGTGYRIRIPQSKSADFFDVIGKCPISEFEYKWK